MNDKLFKILVIALLVLILGAVIGNFIPENPFEDEYIDFEDDDFFAEAQSYSYNRYSFEEFAQINAIEGNLLDEIEFFAQENSFEIELDDEVVYLERETCSQNCVEQFIELIIEDDIVEVTVIVYESE